MAARYLSQQGHHFHDQSLPYSFEILAYCDASYPQARKTHLYGLRSLFERRGGGSTYTQSLGRACSGRLTVRSFSMSYNLDFPSQEYSQAF